MEKYESTYPHGNKIADEDAEALHNERQRVEAGVEEEIDPFSPEYAPKLQLIVSMRIYDVLMALLTSEDETLAERLHELHADGKIMGSLPFINLTD